MSEELKGLIDEVAPGQDVSGEGVGLGEVYAGYGDVIRHLEAARQKVKVPTREQLEAEGRRRRTTGIIAGLGETARALSNLFFTAQGAPSQGGSGSELTEGWRRRWDRIMGERQKNEAQLLNYSAKIAELRDRMYQRGAEAARQKKEEDWRRKNYDRQGEWHADEVAHRDRVYDRQGQWHQEDVERDDRNFKEQQRVNNINIGHTARRLAMEEQRDARNSTFALVIGGEGWTLPAESMNYQTVGRLFNQVPTEIRTKYLKPRMVTGLGGAKVESGEYEAPDMNTMLTAIGEWAGDAKNGPKGDDLAAFKGILSQLGGKQVTAAPAGIPWVEP